jgi:hypothetical protein
MNLSLRARIMLGLLALAGLIAYAIVVDLGVSAGRIHSGVNVRGVDVGGLTRTEAYDELKPWGDRLRNEPVTFTTEGLNFHFLPSEIGWWPNSLATADSAMAVGREGGPVRAVADRFRGWVGGVEIAWEGGPRAIKVEEMIDSWEVQADALGLQIWRGRLRVLIRRAIQTWPRKPWPIPMLES